MNYHGDTVKKRLLHAVWISDLHLGSRGSKTVPLLAYLKSISCDLLYLVGDVLDLWAMKNKVWWDENTTAVLRRLLKMAKQGTRIIWVLGNHDDALRSFIPLALGTHIEIVDEAIHVMPDGLRLLVLHGDRFDFVSKWLSVIGDQLYDLLLAANNILHKVRMLLGHKKYWSLAAYAKRNTKAALNVLQNFEELVISYARKHGCQGVVCGHIHTAKMTAVDGILYLNCGDWVDSLSAIEESLEGVLQLHYWEAMETRSIAA